MMLRARSSATFSIAAFSIWGVLALAGWRALCGSGPVRNMNKRGSPIGRSACGVGRVGSGRRDDEDRERIRHHRRAMSGLRGFSGVLEARGGEEEAVVARVERDRARA